MGGRGIVCVTTCVCGVAWRMTRFVVTTRRTRFTGFFAAWRLRTTFFGLQGAQGFAVWARAAGTSEICIAPPPMIAPPQVQAQSFARAIRTDMVFLSLFPLFGGKAPHPDARLHHRYRLKAKAL